GIWSNTWTLNGIAVSQQACGDDIVVVAYPALVNNSTKTQYPLKSAESFLIGRNETADVCVLDPTCSRHHFRIVRRDGQYHAEALSPTNPTFCNGQRVLSRQPLDHGAVLQAGNTLFQFLLHPAGEATASAPSKYQEMDQTVMGKLPLPGPAVLERELFPL